MVILGSWKQQPFTISSKNNSLTISVEQKRNTTVYSFDKKGRFWTGMIENISYRRGLNGKIIAKWSSGREVLNRRWLSEQEADSLLKSAHQMIAELITDYNSGKVIISKRFSENLLHELGNISNKNQSFYQLEVDKYDLVYKPVGILPPDQYFSVVLQLTEGCSFNSCTFCTFYKDRPFKIKNPIEFEKHIKDVKDFIREGLNLRRTIFLGDANALVVPTRKLIPLVQLIHDNLDVSELGGIFAFLDGFSGEKKKSEDYKLLKSLGLEKIYIGLESGNNALLKFLNKPGTSQDVLSAVKEIKSGGISVGIIILLGAGGKQYSDGHVKDTINLINQMDLDANDIIYFSELIADEGITYTTNAFENNLQPLTTTERILQRKMIEKALFFRGNDSPHISQYDIRDFVY